MVLRFEAWTLPTSPTFEKLLDIPEALAGSSGVRELSAFSDERLLLPASWPHIDQLVTSTAGSWIRVYDGSAIVDEFLAERVAKLARRPSVRTVSGPQRNGVVERIGIYPKNWPAHRPNALDWKWGFEDIMPDLSRSALGYIKEEWELFTTASSGTFTLTVDGETTESIPYNASANRVEGSGIDAGTGLQGLDTVDDVTVVGSGTASDPWVITFYSPPDPGSVSVNGAGLSGGTATLTRTVEGALDPSPITRAKPVDEGTDTEEQHGTYGDPAIEIVYDNLDTDADWALKVNAVSGYAGSQVILSVVPEESYNFTVRVKPTSSGDYILVIRDRFGGRIARAIFALTSGSYQTLSLENVTIPPGVTEVIFRASVDESDVAVHYVNWQGATVTTGNPPATFTEIVGDLLAAAHERETAEFLELDATDEEDSLGTSLDVMSFEAPFGGDAHLGRVLDEGARMGYHYQVVPAEEALVITPTGSHVLQIYFSAAGQVEDLTATANGPSVTAGGKVEEAEVVSRVAPYTALLAHGQGAVTVEDTTSAVSTMGRLERIVDAEQVGDAAGLQALIDATFAQEAVNRQAATAQVLDTDSSRPLIDYGPGSKIWWQFPGLLTKEARPVRRISWTHGTPVKYEVQGSWVLSDEGGLAAAVDKLLREWRRRRSDRTAPSGSATITGLPGAHIHAIASPQEIPSGGAAIEWTEAHTPIPLAGFGTHSYPTDEFVVTQPGYYDVDVELGWDSWTNGGRVWIVRSRGGEPATLWPPASTPGSWLLSGTYRRFTDVAPAIPCVEGDRISVWVDHLDADPRVLSYATVGFYLVDRAAEPVQPPPPPQNIYVFTTSGTFDWAAAGSPATLSDVWVIGGGGGGSKRANDNWRGGGGGAGGVLHLEDYAISGNVAVVVGYGGAGGTGPTDELKNGGYGGPSSFDGQVAAGGGFGAIGGSSQGASGGCGGGGGAVGALTRNGGAGSQGGDGGDGGSGHAGGGGGGAGGNGADGASGVGGNGGAGIDLSSVVGTDYGEAGWFAGGGGGTGASSNGTGSAGGGDGTGQHALANTGGGGGAGPNTGGGNGGTGIVIVKVAD